MSSPSPDVRPAHSSTNARSAIVNRTHRVVRERAAAMEARKRRLRDLLLPFCICSAVLWMIAHAVWSTADQSLAGIEGGAERILAEVGSDAGGSFTMLMVWFLPISVITAAVILLRKSRPVTGYDEASR